MKMKNIGENLKHCIFIFVLVLTFSVVGVNKAHAVCTGQILTNEADAKACANQAEATGKSLEYTISCKTESVSLIVIDPNTGLDHYYNSTCTVNGSVGHGAYLLEGFEASAGSNALVPHINPGWEILKTELAYENAKGQCGGGPVYGSIVNGLSVYSCTDPNPPKITPITPKPGTGSTGSGGGTSGGVKALPGCTASGYSLSTGKSCIGGSGTIFDTDNDGIPDNIDDEVDFIDSLGVGKGIKANIAVSPTPTSSPTIPTSCVAAPRSGMKNGVYRYTFTKNSNGTWNVSLNNKAYSMIGDKYNKYYIPANFSFDVTSAADLNTQNEGRFNHLESLPGTIDGNTEYDNIFGSFINAYYDWAAMTKDMACTATATQTTQNFQTIFNHILGSDLEVDGKIGPKTIAAMADIENKFTGKMPPHVITDAGVAVKDFQHFLNTYLGTDLEIDGKIGPNTLSAITVLTVHLSDN